ncbi:oxidoreductase-like protein [Leptomonas pyrrhocoris]|uniref:Oxidoreductase-like protein n=1 Tax=Leptomonas pyrrhocoris TaxID=157538 RepID=A0A0M9G774_LEPPY|nr:oxidoreductase-like protein [Leptomonas pyrrhocoris]XP_015662478.1 oxidoreductase-like protein [Leptomonas pyrrhocoris]XP_015662479.1 oxidoreductase-like protein [Leptomonas pyrrhocoris]XP_015662480.1 oxidoreductase-like protein [Leptomonas pyrrhocoris]KPA84038.1 oxidoreductase-like protein [Leptomonas pyrrhocoris]KPA84039.1 oxidoreductase-like protein [Leptomonas pyrrhocoris]KPA84040.1 oxidoreductase-like protein [Leptomonas pyrrhocoris]KPA84041.1 oxidoreductase-like protein [Leptomonas |eukprot:XP_015662477.1 oxidoreductase-like protein [Leptomonas pyrrhocoris]
MSDTTIKVGFLGASSIAHKVWAAIEAAGNMQVTMVGCRNQEAGQKFIDESMECLKISPDRKAVAASYDEVVTSPDVDVVYISIPVTLRHEWVMKCAEHGKHVVGEKPPASSPEQLQSWLEALSANGLLYMDGTMFSHGPYVQKVIDCLPQIGELRHMSSAVSFHAGDERVASDIRGRPDMEPAGALGDCGWYCVRSFLHMVNFKMPIAVSGRIVEQLPNGAIVAFKGDLTFKGETEDDNIYATFFCGFMSSSEQYFIASGSKGRIVANQLTNPLTDVGPTHFQVINPIAGDFAPTPDIKTEDVVTDVEVPEETGHLQETQMWRDVRDCLKKDADGTLIAEEDAVRQWGRKAWITQTVVAKLLESARS